MAPIEVVKAKQACWANARDLVLCGSTVSRGAKLYTETVDHNLFMPLSDAGRKEIESGDGGELTGGNGRKEKMCALHSSSALGVNVFDFWRTRKSVTLLTAACGLTNPGSVVAGNISFERKFPIVDRFTKAPNIDVVIECPGKSPSLFAIECKFTECYGGRPHGGLDPKYFDGVDWGNLGATRELAKSISPDDSQYEYLHVAQLVKHLLGLRRECGSSGFRLLYLWYDVLGEPGAKHRAEADTFANIVKDDGVLFSHMTYQELIVRLSKAEAPDDEFTDYVTYLATRYL